MIRREPLMAPREFVLRGRWREGGTLADLARAESPARSEWTSLSKVGR
jgi:hypothetical protein